MDDYPAAAVRAAQEGVVGVKLFIDAAGRVAACSVSASSNSAELDAATCSLLTRRARFAPLAIAPGAQFAGVYTTSVRWRIDGPSTQPSLADALSEPTPLASGSASPFSAATTAAMRCAAVTAATANPTLSQLTLSARAGYFLILAASYDTRGKELMARAGDLSARIADFMVPASERPTLFEKCTREYPQAYRATPSTLPAESFARDTVCLVTIGVMQGAAQSYEKASGDSSYSKKYSRALEILQTRLTDKKLSDMGYKTDADYQRYMGDQLFSVLSIGNADTVADACIATYR